MLTVKAQKKKILNLNEMRKEMCLIFSSKL